MDEDVTTSDFVGSTMIKISTFTRLASFDEWFNINYKGEPAGKIHLKTNWTPETYKSIDKS